MKSDRASCRGCCSARFLNAAKIAVGSVPAPDGPTEMNGICEQWYDATVGPPCRPAAALTLGMFATWLSTIVAVLVILVKSLLGAKAKRP